jgi:hypothetical protein
VALDERGPGVDVGAGGPAARQGGRVEIREDLVDRAALRVATGGRGRGRLLLRGPCEGGLEL